MNFNEYKLIELFNKIDIILQKFFGEEEQLSFCKKENYISKLNLTKRKYVMYLSNGDSFKIDIPKSTIPHLIGINVDYLRETGLYKDISTYDIMLDFIRNPKRAFKNHNEGIIDLNQVISPYIDKKLDSILDNLIIKTNYCDMVCKYDKSKTYGYNSEFDKMDYLILQNKDDKYYVLKLAQSKEKGVYYPMSNQVYNTYEEFCEKFSTGLFNQEITLLNGLRMTTNGYNYDNNFNIFPSVRKQKLEKLGKIAKDLSCVPNVLHDYIYSLGIMDNRRNSNTQDNEILSKLSECMMEKIPFDLNEIFVNSEILTQLINNYNDSLYKDIDSKTSQKFSDISNENIELKKQLEDALHKIDTKEEIIRNSDKQLDKYKILYKDANEKLDKIKEIIGENKNFHESEVTITYEAKRV